MRHGVVLLLLLASCRQLLGFESASVPSDGAPPDTVDAPIGCTTAESCPETAPLCIDDICVECTPEQPALCQGTEPVCGADQHCRPCASHAECVSEVCLPDGACADPSNVAYVDPVGSGTACTQTAPCPTLQLAVATPHSIIKLTGTVTSTNVVSILRSLAIHADPGAVVTRVSTSGPILDIRDPAQQVEIFDLTISGGLAVGIKHDGGQLHLERVRLLDNAGFGIESRLAGGLRMRRCIVARNVGGGIDVDNGTLEITNSLVVRNGSAGTSSGGLRLKPVGASVVDLVTIADNVSSAGNEGGIRCNADGITVTNSIVVGNSADDNCTFTNSLFSAGPPVGPGNLVGDPGFLSTTDPLAADFYRLGPASAAIDQAVSTLGIDLDGDARPQGAGPDIGADERP